MLATWVKTQNSSSKSRKFTDVCMMGGTNLSTNLPRTIQTSVNFRNFTEPHLRSLKTYHLASLLILKRFFSGVDGFSPTCSYQTSKKIVEGSLSRNEEIAIQKFYRERIFVRVNSRAHTWICELVCSSISNKKAFLGFHMFAPVHTTLYSPGSLPLKTKWIRNLCER